MKKMIAIISGEPNSISSEIIFKTWKLRKKFKHKPFFIIGNVDLLNRQKKKLKFKFDIKQINENFKTKDLLGSKLPIINIKYSQKKTFDVIGKKSAKYIFNSFNCALKLLKENKVYGIINCPISKENLLDKRYHGITEYLAKKTNKKGNEVMVIYSSKFSVSPLTTHIPLRKVHKKISQKLIIKKINIINSFYKKNLKFKPNIGILGLNPHNYSGDKISEEKKIIVPAIKKLKQAGLKVTGPISPDTGFLFQKKYDLNIIVGMYHDQVLTSFKTINKFKAINITLGLPFIRISPDHGIGQDIVGKKIANPESLVESIKFFNNLN